MKARTLCMWLVSLTVVLEASGYTNDPLVSVSRYCSADTVVVGGSFEMRFQIDNSHVVPLHGFFLSDQVPRGLSIVSSTVRVNGVVLEDCIRETGNVGEIYDECIPYRWVLETPPAFSEMHPIPPGGTVEIECEVTCGRAGTHVFKNFGWSGAVPTGIDTSWAFGHDDDSLTIVVDGLGVNEEPTDPEIRALSLLACQPNPFRGATVVTYEVPCAGQLSIRLYDSSGRVVRNLVNRRSYPGSHRLYLDARDLADGVYFVRLEAGGRTATQKAVLVK